MHRLLHAVLGVAVAAVPAVGWFVGDWTAGTTLLVYWFETVASCLFVAVRIAAHQRWRPSRGHFRHRPRGGRPAARGPGFLSGYLVTTLAFSAAHGLFLAVILVLLSRTGHAQWAAVDWRSAANGCVLVLVLLAVDLAADLPRLAGWSFSGLEQLAVRSIGRVAVVHLTLVCGLFALALTDAPSALFGIFVALRTLYQLSLALPQWEPATPPAWLSAAMNRLPQAHAGQRFEDSWARDRLAEADRRQHNDQPWTNASRPGNPDPIAP